jgi:hypothetical protein
MLQDGATLPLTDITAQVMNHRAEVYRSRHPLTRADPQPTEFEWIWTNVPYYHFQNPRSRRLDFDTPVGRMDPEQRLGAHLAYLPLDLDIEEGDWIRDVTVRKDGTRSRGYGRWFQVRMNPRFFEPPEGMEEAGHIVVGIAPDEHPPARLQAAVAA